MGTPHTLDIINQVQNLINTYAIDSNSNPLYKTVAIGAVKDWTEAWPVCEIMIVEDDTKHWKDSGAIRDTQGFRVTTAVNYSTQTPLAAVTQFITIRDIVIPIFQQRAYLGGIVQNVGDSRVKPGSPRISFMVLDSGDYIVHEFIVEVRQDYYVPIGAQGI
jgi:hypothetical protein